MEFIEILKALSHVVAFVFLTSGSVFFIKAIIQTRS